MPIVYKTGNILDDDAQVLVNPVNLVGVMGKGLAADFKRLWPKYFEDYKKWCAIGPDRPAIHIWYGANEHGDISDEWDYECVSHVIVSVPTKGHWREAGSHQLILRALDELQSFLVWGQIRSVAIPKLGCGLGGLDWPTIRSDIINFLDLKNTEVRIYGEGPNEFQRKDVQPSG